MTHYHKKFISSNRGNESKVVYKTKYGATAQDRILPVLDIEKILAQTFV